MSLKINFLFFLISISFFCSAQHTNHESLLTKSSKFDIANYDTYEKLEVDANFRLIQRQDKEPYLKSSAKDQTITMNGENIGRVVVYSRLFKNIDSVSNNGELRIRVYRKNYDKPVMNFVKSFKYDTNQEFHYNFTSPNIHKVELTYNNDDNNYWIIEKLKLSELNKTGIDVYQNIEIALKERQNLKEDWENIRNSDKIRISKAIEYIRKQNQFVKYIEDKLDTDDLEKARNTLYNPTNNKAFDIELNKVFKNASISNVQDFKNDYQSIKNGNWDDALMNVDHILTGGKFQSLIGLIGNLFKNGKYKTENDKEYVYTQVNKRYYAAELKNYEKLVFRPIEDDNNVSFSAIKKRQDTIQALQQYVLVLREFQIQDLKEQEKYKSQIALAKGELQKLKGAWVTLVAKMDSNKIYNKLEEREVTGYLDNEVLGPMASCNKLEEYEKYFDAISEFDKKVKGISINLGTLASEVKNFNDVYYIDVYRDIENQNGRISIVKSIKNLPVSISNQFENYALALQNNYQDKIKDKFQDFTTITYSE
jgi:hypothetical protein